MKDDWGQTSGKQLPPLPFLDDVMNIEKKKQIRDVTLYLKKGDIPWYQRSWIWGSGALVVFFCGLLTAFLLTDHSSPQLYPDLGINSPKDLNNLLSLQQATNSGLEEEVKRLEELLETDVCQPEQNRGDIPATETGSSGELSTDELVKLLEASTVIVITDKGHGTGFFVTPKIIITNGHVVSGSRRIHVANKTLGRAIPATLVNTVYNTNTGGRDYAILLVKTDVQATTLTFTEEARKLAEVAVAGYPGLYAKFDPNVVKPGQDGIPEMVMMQGAINVVHEFLPGIPVISHTASIYKGNSGGPLVNSCGQVVGINTFKLSTTETGRSQDAAVMINFTLGSSDLLRYLKEQDIPLQQASQPCGT